MMNNTGALKSSWTPLKKGSAANEQLFEERRALLFKWWQKWTNEQRVVILQDLLENSRNEQKQFAETHLKKTFPARQLDFTRVLPRHLSLYIFSFLDPRSLCRCSQVCWFWKYLTEEDVLWMAKNLRFGWDLGFKPTPFETGIWKRNYIQKVEDLILNNPDPEPASEKKKSASKHSRDHHDLEEASPSRGSNRRSTMGGTSSSFDPPPWKANDRHPTDLIRYNFLDNDDSRDRSQYLFADKKQKAMQSKREEMMRKSMTGVNIPPGFTLPQPLSHSQKSPPGYKAAAGHHTSSKMIQEMQKNYAETGSLIRTQTSPVKSILRNSMSVTQSLSKHEQRPSPNYEQAERENSTESSPESKQLTASFSGTTPMFGLPVGPGGDDPRAKLRAPSPSKSIGITRTSRDLPSHDLFPVKPWKLADAEDSD
ncbi:F-box only protein 16-like [Symsagittifera roscoffensis]|uniref:F-box only protein 16-like n=1 Tax=Symsagittifera roscoffensis TaxID=84072 RepID=UPI00307B4CE3